MAGRPLALVLLLLSSLALAQAAWRFVGSETTKSAWAPAAEGQAFTPDPDGGFLFTFGGFFYDATFASITSRADLWRYSSAGASWQLLAAAGPSQPSPRGRACMALARGGGSLLIFGGRLRTNTLAEDFADVWTFNLSAGVWTEEAPPADALPGPQPRGASACAMRGDSLVVFGGSNSGGSVFADVFAFHLPTRTWSTVVSPGPGQAGTGWPARAAGMAQLWPTSPPPLFGTTAAYDADADVFFVHGGRTPGVSGMTANAVVSAATFALVFLSGLQAPAPPAVAAQWAAIPVVGAAPPLAYATPSYLSAQRALCAYGGSDYVGSNGERLTESLLCLRLADLLAAWQLVGVPATPATSISEGAQGVSNFSGDPDGPPMNGGPAAVAAWVILSDAAQGSATPGWRQRAAGGAIASGNDGATQPRVCVSGGITTTAVVSDTYELALPNFTDASAWSLATGPPPYPTGQIVRYLLFAGTLMTMTGALLVIVAWRLRMRRLAEQQDVADAIAAIAGQGNEADASRGLSEASLARLPRLLFEPPAGKTEPTSASSSASVAQPPPAVPVPPVNPAAGASASAAQSPFWALNRSRAAGFALLADPGGSGLRQLARASGPPASRSADSEERGAVVSPRERVAPHCNWSSQVECSVCLSDFAVGEELIVLPCLHRFHSECVLQWLERSVFCPICKSDVEAQVVAQVVATRVQSRTLLARVVGHFQRLRSPFR